MCSARVSWSVRDEKGEEVSSGPAETGLGLPGFLSAGFPDDQPHTDTCTVKSAKYKTAYEMEDVSIVWDGLYFYAIKALYKLSSIAVRFI